MRTFCHSVDLRTALQAERKQGKTIAFVPTMGNLHDGHMNLVQEAQSKADITVVSIFVNPLQFCENEDLDNYPRTLAADKAKLFEAGVAYLFSPDNDEIYPQGKEAHTTISVPKGLTDILCGANRPGHFTGVTTIVHKLFNIVQPDYAIFGNKDFQQLAVIRKMVTDLMTPIELIGVDTVRDEDGLAKSSRNGYLDAQERAKAPLLHQALLTARDAVLNDTFDVHELETQARQSLDAQGFATEYFTILDASSLQPVQIETKTAVILVAAKLGQTRLIDNISFNPSSNSNWGFQASN